MLTDDHFRSLGAIIRAAVDEMTAGAKAEAMICVLRGAGVDTGDIVRSAFLAMPADDRPAAFVDIDICTGCGVDLRKADGSTFVCHCTNDE
jgi:hypothetical protein